MVKPQGQRRPEAKKAKNTSVAKRIRDVKRLLSKDTIDAKMRQSLVKKLAVLEQESAENKAKLREQKYAVRYHKVRFFERIKLERRIQKLQKALKQGINAEETRQELFRAREDLEYVLHFPKGEKFVSLLKDAEDPEAQAHLERERERLRALVKQQLRDDAIVNELNEGGMRESDDEDAPDGAAAAGFGQDLEEDDFFANASGEESDSIDQGVRDSDASASDESGSDEGGHGVEVAASARAEVDSADVELFFDDMPGTVDAADNPSSLSTSDTSENDESDDHRDGAEEKERAFRKQAAAPRRGNPKTKQELRGRKGDRRDSSNKGKRDAVGKIAKAKTPKKGQPLRTRAEGGRKRRPKKK